MRTIGTDTFAMSNPALTSLILWQFTKSYEMENETGPPLSLSFIVLPIAMSRLIAETFKGTNTRTGFLTWLTRYPELTLQLPARIGATRDLTCEALRFGIAYRLFTITKDGNLSANQQAISFASRPPSTDERLRMLRIASHLGKWLIHLPQPTVFYSLGMTP